MIRVSADLGQQNIPDPIVKLIVPVQTLYLRVAAGKKTIEIWRDAAGKFYVLEGDFKDGVWGQQDVKIAYEPRDLDDARAFVNSNYQITADDGVEMTTSSFKRLVRKVQGS
jgi:hypothetical protein